MKNSAWLRAIFVTVSLFSVLPGCSNTDVKKKVIGSDASTGDGSVGASSCNAGEIFNYSTAQCSACPAGNDSGVPACAPDGPVYHCNLGCSDIDLTKSGVDATKQQVTVAFSYPLDMPTVNSVEFLETTSAPGDGGVQFLSNTDYPTTIAGNVLSMDLSAMSPAEFAQLTRLQASAMELTDACGRSNSVTLCIEFDLSGNTWAPLCPATCT